MILSVAPLTRSRARANTHICTHTYTHVQRTLCFLNIILQQDLGRVSNPPTARVHRRTRVIGLCAEEGGVVPFGFRSEPFA